MKELLMQLLYAIVLSCVPVLTGYLIALIQKAGAKVTAATQNEKVRGYVREITEAVTKAVGAVMQTYVDGLKATGEFKADAQKEALQMALNAAKATISPAAQDFIMEVYGDIGAYLTMQIEAEVRNQKNSYAALCTEGISPGTLGI